MVSCIRLRPIQRAAIAAVTLFVTPGIALPLPLPVPAAAASGAGASDIAEVAAAFPAGTLLCVAIPNLATFRAQFAESSLYKIWMEPQVQKFLEKPLGLLKAGMQKGMPPELDLKAAENLFTGPVALALTGITLPKPGANGPPDIGLVFYARASSAERLTAFRGMLEKLASSLANVKPEQKKVGGADVAIWTLPGAPIAIASAQQGDRFYVSLSQAALESVLALASGKGASLASDASYQKVAAKLTASESPILYAYVSVEGFVNLLTPLMPGPVRAVLEKVGMNSLKAVGLGTAVKEGAFVDTSFVYAPAPRAGLFRLMQSDPIDPSHLSIVPKEVTGLSIARMNLAPVWDCIWDAVAAYDPATADQWKKGLAAFEQQLGFAVKADFLDSLGTELVIYSKPSVTGFPDFLVYVELKNPQKFAECLQKATSKVPDLKIKELPVGESKAYYLDLAQLGPAAAFIQPAYGFAGDYLVCSLSLQSVRSALTNFGAKDKPSVRDNEAFKALLAGVPQNATSLSFTDSRQSFESMYNAARGFLPFVLASAGQDLPFDFALLPTSDAITKYLAPGISFGFVDADGFAGRSRSTISGVMVLPVIGVGAAAGAAVQARRQVAQDKK